MRAIISVLLLFTLLIEASALADTGPLGFGSSEIKTDLETDRPDFTEGTQPVEPGHLQLEGGYTYLYDDEDDIEVEAHQLPELLLRIGLIKDLEARLAWAGYVRERTTVESDTGRGIFDVEGVTDMSVGFKHRMYEQDEAAANISYIFELGLPVGSDELSSDKVKPVLKFVLARDLSDSAAVAANLNFASIHGEEERYLEVSASASLGLSITDTVGAYFEYFALFPEDASGDEDTHYADAGLTFGLSENLQLDVRAGLGLNDDAADLFAGAGFALRI